MTTILVVDKEDDDIIVFSRSLGEHERRFEDVFHPSVVTELKLKPSKCALLQIRSDRVEYMANSVVFVSL